MAEFPVFSFVAFSGTGKTSYLEQVVSGLCRAGVRVGVLKHDGHEFEPDQPGKDSWRFAQAGAVVTAVSSGTKTMWVERRALSPEQALSRFCHVDLVLTEGYKRGPWPKIAVYRSQSGQPLCMEPEDCAAIVSDVPLTAPCPVFSIHNPEPMVQWLLQQMRRNLT